MTAGEADAYRNGEPAHRKRNMLRMERTQWTNFNVKQIFFCSSLSLFLFCSARKLCLFSFFGIFVSKNFFSVCFFVSFSGLSLFGFVLRFCRFGMFVCLDFGNWTQNELSRTTEVLVPGRLGNVAEIMTLTDRQDAASCLKSDAGRWIRGNHCWCLRIF